MSRLHGFVPVLAAPVAALLVAMAAGPVVAQTPQPRPAADASRSSGPVSDAEVVVNADSLQLSEVDRVAVFRGAVEAVQGALVLRAEEMRVRYGDAESADGPQVDTIDATGGVVILHQGDEIRGDRATYDVAAGVFEARGDVVLLREGSRILGQHFVGNLVTGESEMLGRVTVEFTPRSNRSGTE